MGHLEITEPVTNMEADCVPNPGWVQPQGISRAFDLGQNELMSKS